MNNRIVSWGIFVLICLIWGSSFILMKWGLYDANQQAVLSPYNVAALRLLSAGVVMLPFLPDSLKALPKRIVWYILLTGWLGSFFPSFLFCIAETKTDSALTGCLNSLTPLFVIISGALFYRLKTSRQKIFGVIIGIGGSVLLFIANDAPLVYIAYGGFVILAAFLYGLNVNMVYQKLNNVSSMHIATIAFAGLIPPSLIVLLITGYFKLPLAHHAFVLSTLASCILGVVGTAAASWLFYVLIKKAGGLFASLVTYGVPFIAILWGIYYGEKITYLHLIALFIILLGVYFATRSEKKQAE